MREDVLGELVEVAVKLTAEERRQLLRQAESLLSQRAGPGQSIDSERADVPGETSAREARPAGLAPCPRCGLVPAASETYCGRCGNKVAF